jgi:dTDP-L-rhamnose 4-epimerase
VSERRVLVTGGAGFIGSHLVDRLLSSGYRVRVLDSLLPQVHPRAVASDLDPRAELRVADICNGEAVRSALDGIDIVVHLAAAVGVGQSMYEITHYSSVNVVGTATLLEAIVKGRLPVRRLVVASSMSVYGEGRYECASCGSSDPEPRPEHQLANHDWAMYCPGCKRAMSPCPTPEIKRLAPTSVYAISKRDQEEMVLAIGRSAGIPAVALRFFNVYGERQALSNPYTGVGAIFSSALLNGKRPLIFEDGLQVRDFIHVSDIATACMAAVERKNVRDIVINVGTGQPTSVRELAMLLASTIPGASGLTPEIAGRFRHGDIRGCYADITLAREALKFSPAVSLERGVKDLARWVGSQTCVDRAEVALTELNRHRLIR